MNSPPIQLFKSEADAAEFETAYKRLLETWNTPTTSINTPTQFGVTHLLKSVETDGPPLILVPGGQGTAAMWGPVADKIKTKRTIFAVDLIDQVGRSQPSKVLLSPDDAADWLAEVIQGLGLTEFDLVGNSIGAFIASAYALKHQERIKTLTLLAPAATISELNPNYILSVLTAMVLPGRYWKKRFLRNTSASQLDIGDPLFDLLELAMAKSKTVSKLMPKLLPIHDLKTPTLIVLGDKDPVSRDTAQELRESLKDLAQIDVEILNSAGHLWTQAEFALASSYLDNLLRD